MSIDESLINQLPNDVLQEIFFRTPGQDLMKKCLIICKKWNFLIDNESFWIEKCLRDKTMNQEKLKILRNLEDIKIEAKQLYFNYESLFEKNFLKNPCGDEKFKYWCFCRQMRVNHLEEFNTEEINNIIKLCKDSLNTANKDASVLNIWQIQRGDDDQGTSLCFNKENMPCNKFATSYILAEKMQLVDLYKEFFLGKDLHKFKAKLEISEYYAPRFDCGCKYNLCVYLIDDNFKLVDYYKFDDEFAQWSENTWKQTTHLFDIKEQIRYILFYHSGVDTQFWAGFYGSKMTNGSIRIIL